MNSLQLTVNTVPRQADAPAHTTLLGWLRDQGLTGCKEGCAEGECGACAVLVARRDERGGTRWDSVNACLITLAALDGAEVITAEGLSALHGALHPVQHELGGRGGSQCGYCTPGFVSSMAAEYYRLGRSEGEHGAPNGFDIHALSGNLCRCTGYRPIRDAAYALGTPGAADPLAQRRERPAPPARYTKLVTPQGSFLRPATLPEALELLAEYPSAKLLAGGTDWNVEVNIRHSRAETVIAIDALPELRELNWNTDHILIGAGLNLSEIERRLGGRVPLLAQLLPQFASRLIRNSATLGGNLGTASPIGDSPGALLALEAVLVLAGPGGEREVPLAEFFTGYRRNVMGAGELIRAVKIPLPLAPLSDFHKIAKRRFDDISSVAVAFAFDVRSGVIHKARIGLGGVAATPIRAYEAEAALDGQPWTLETVRRVAPVLRGAGTPISDHRASAEYRSAMLEQALLKFFYESRSGPVAATSAESSGAGA